MTKEDIYAESFKEVAIKALARYNMYEVYDIAGCHHDAAVYAELKAELDFRRTFSKAIWNDSKNLTIYLRPGINANPWKLLVRQSKGYEKNEITDLGTYLDNYYKQFKCKVSYLSDHNASVVL